MRYEELITLVHESEPADWALLNRSAAEPVRLGAGSYEYLAHHKADLDVALAWGADANRGEEWGKEWAAWSHFPDPKVRGFWAELLWRGTPVTRTLLVTADGNRVYLPNPTPVNDHADTAPDATTWTVTSADLPIPRLLNGIQHKTVNFDEAMKTAGFTIEG
ncbi:MAG TPA: hypothetical protein VHW44_10680 [Pseudonocardiaceae bacterium]|jgi:hypothetical protein|nr:hypothetical protein [Pseudonocardiaceae bacterium]